MADKNINDEDVGVLGIDRTYRDDTEIPNENEITEEIESGTISPFAEKLATFIIQKMKGKQERYAMALDVLLKDKRFNDLAAQVELDIASNKEISDAFEELLEQFKDVIANATTDSEMILSRKDKWFGEFKTLWERLDKFSDLLASKVDESVELGIKHDLGFHPNVKAFYYENAIGTNGFLNHYPVFGDTTLINNSLTYQTTNQLTVKLPVAFKPVTKVVVQAVNDSGTFSISNISKYVTDFNRVVDLVAVDSTYKELGRVSIHQNGTATLDGLLNVDEIKDDTLTGTYTDKVSKVRLFTSDPLIQQEDGCFYLTDEFEDSSKTIKIELRKEI